MIDLHEHHKPEKPFPKLMRHKDRKCYAYFIELYNGHYFPGVVFYCCDDGMKIAYENEFENNVNNYEDTNDQIVIN